MCPSCASPVPVLVLTGSITHSSRTWAAKDRRRRGSPAQKPTILILWDGDACVEEAIEWLCLDRSWCGVQHKPQRRP